VRERAAKPCCDRCPEAGAKTNGPAAAKHAFSGPGEALDAGVRATMSERIGFDFANVRVHNDARAAASTDALDARAFTVGRHVAFAKGEYAPNTAAGSRLLAHELTHVAQQRGASMGVQAALEVPAPGQADEHEADTAAERVSRGLFAGPIREQPVALRRKIKESIVEDFQPNAKVCMVQLHGDEKNALQVAKQMRKGRCANLVFLEQREEREMHVEDIPWTSGKKSGKASCIADPNRVFTTQGWMHEALGECKGMPAAAESDVRNAASLELKTFADTRLRPSIDTCRRSMPELKPKSPVSDAMASLPVVAFHNNTPVEDKKPKARAADLTIKSYQKGGKEAGATETDTSRLGGATNPHVEKGEDIDNFMLATEKGDFDALSKRRNIVLQSTTPTDDGSLSVALKDTRYINIEAQGKRTLSAPTHTRFIANWNMANEVMTQLGIPPTCDAPEPELSREDCEAAKTSEALPVDCSSLKTKAEKNPNPLPDDLLKDALPRGRARTDRCYVFPDQASLDGHKLWWRTFIDTIASAKLASVVDWIIGADKPPAAVTEEVALQQKCMLGALKTAAKDKSSGLALDKKKGAVSEHRSFAEQEKIWTDKFDLTRTTKFDRVSPLAASKCSKLKPGDQWDPKDPDHQDCWKKQLTDAEREQEILQASSAPGVSRHHWGSDIDLFSVEPAEWAKGKTGKTGFWDEYTWLMKNASSYGFVQSFLSTTGGYGKGYMEERWHYSYYPVAQALLEFTKANDGAIDTALQAKWGKSPKFAFIAKNWRAFMFNVGQKGQF
jgi:hypothetical protein